MEADSRDPSPANCPRFPIVGVGASAGGLDALRRLLEAVPDDPKFAIVIVHHLARDRPSLAPELLAKYTRMPVKEVEDGPQVKIGHVYIIPPDQFLSIDGGRLSLIQMEGPRRAPVAIDFFFRALAKDQRECGVGIILSGTGSDGTLGVKAIKEAGGLVLAQDPSSAEHTGMPDSVIETGIVDQVLAPDAMPAALAQFAEHDYIRGTAATAAQDQIDTESDDVRRDSHIEADGTSEVPSSSPTQDPGEPEHGFSEIIAILGREAKRDFRNYKPATLSRRTSRRMCLHHIEKFDDYCQFLKTNPDEVQALAKDLLISVTDFFRDRQVWERLAAKVIPAIVASKSSDDVIRLWSAGCATGEEAYTVAMLFLEEISKQRKACGLQVFASDIDTDALDQARMGNYPISIESDVSPERLKRFFTLRDGTPHYQVNKSLREIVVFADQNLISDPPFSQLDLICCRNLLIYLKSELQQKIIALFHFALHQPGYLLLGTAETIGRHDDLFETVDKGGRIFQSIGRSRQDRLSLPSARFGPRREFQIATRPTPPQRPTQIAQQALLALISPTAILIDRQWRILYISGDVNAYLTHQEGVPNDDLLRKIVPSLRSQLRAAVHQAYQERTTARVAGTIHSSSGIRDVHIDVRLIPGEEPQHDFALIHFDGTTDEKASPTTWRSREAGDARDTKPVSNKSSSQINESALINQLETELSATRDDLQSTVEQFEIATEESMASNEEVMSINEELQSTNEELETSKEELQSLNEELSTVNLQLAGKVDELEIKHADLQNLIAATDVATICLGTDLTIRWFTPAAKELIRIKPADIGRPLHDLQDDFLNDNITDQCELVLQKLIPIDKEVECSRDRTFYRRIVPYRTDDHRIGGVVITLVDITSLKKREDELRESESKLRELNQTLEQKVIQRTELLSILQDTTKIANEAKSVNEAMVAAMDKLGSYNSWRLGHVWKRSDGAAECDETAQWGIAPQSDGPGREANAMHRATAHSHFPSLHGGEEPQSPAWISSGIWHVEEDLQQRLTGLAEFQRRTEQMRIVAGEGLIARVGASGQPQQVRDITETQDEPRSRMAALNLHGAIAFPITVDGEVVAIMEFFSEQQTNPEPAFLEIMSDVGIQLGHVIQRKRLERVVAKIANEEEKRIGRELHDGIAQQLTGGALIAESLRNSLPQELTAQRENVDHIIEILRTTHEDVGRLSRGLMPDTVAAPDLQPSLRGLIAETQKRYDINIHFLADEFDESFVRVDSIAATIYQIARESLHNSLKHSGSHVIDVEISTDIDFRLVVQDHGDGFDMRSVKPTSNGLRIMRYRAESVGGELMVQSVHHQGTRIVLTIPRKRCQS